MNNKLDPEIMRYSLIGNAEIVCLSETESTNNEAKRRIAAGLAGDALIIAQRQTAGRGQQGNSFFSLCGGIYITAVFAGSFDDCAKVTIAAAVAATEALQDATGQEIAIKWVNDLYYNGKKICGILAETIGKMTIVGIGINCDAEERDFPAELQGVAGGIPLNGASRERLIADIYNRLKEYIATDFARVIKRYRAQSLMYGIRVSYRKNGEIVTSSVEEIDDCGRLIVIDDFGVRDTLCSVSIMIS